MNVLLVPGLGNSGPDHWLSHWEKALPASRADLGEWDDPYPQDWVANLDAAIATAGPDVVLVAHSLGCATVVRWAKGGARSVRAALLVAPADVDSDAHVPPAARRFAPMPMDRLPFISTVVASTNDPYADFARSEEFAHAWGARLVGLGPVGHINADSALGSWPKGRALLEGLVRSA
jgi:predicted alpha/beta hydrolase family esterase